MLILEIIEIFIFNIKYKYITKTNTRMSIGAYNYYLNHDDYDCLSLSRSGLSGQQQPSSRVDIVQVGMCSTHAARSTSSEERAIRSRSARSHSGSDSHPARNRRQGG